MTELFLNRIGRRAAPRCLRARARAQGRDRGSGGNRSRAKPGFTLIELLLAMSVFAVLAAIALPACREQVARARRAEVQAALLEDAGYMQRYYDANNAYTGSPPPALAEPVSPRAGTPAYVVTLDVSATTPTGFLLVATRTGAMTGDPCGDFTYDHLGRRGLVEGSFAPGRSAAECWR